MKSVYRPYILNFFPWLVLFLCLIIILQIWRVEDRFVLQKAEYRFQLETQAFESDIETRLLKYELMLKGCVGLFNASISVERDEWKAYVQAIDPVNNYPGIQAIGFCKRVPAPEKETHILQMRAEGFSEYGVKPAGERTEYCPVIYLEPFSGRNIKLIGYDAYFESVRRTSLEQARDMGVTTMSGKLKLKQETEQEIQNGFLLNVPVYEKNLPLVTAENRRKALCGFVYGAFRINDFMAGVLENDPDKIYTEIYDGRTTSGDALLYNSGGARPEAVCLFEKKSELEFFGRTWTLHFKTLPAFETAIDRSRQLFRACILLFISFLLCTIAFLIVSRSKRLAAEIIRREWEQEILRRSEEQYRTLFEDMTQGAFVQDADGRLIDINPAGLRIFGVSRDEFLSRDSYCPAWRVIGEDGALLQPEEHPSMAALLTGQPVRDAIYGLFNPETNSYVWLIANATPRFIPGESKPFQVFVTLHDVTARKLAEDSIKASAAYESALLSAIPDIIMEVDTHKVYTWANSQGFKFFGDDVIGHEAAFYFVGEQDTYRHVEQLFLGNEDTVYVESWQKRRDGQKRLLAWWSHVLKDIWGNVIGVIASARDITEQKQAAEELRMASQKWRITFDAMLDPVALLSAEACVEQCNRAFVDFLGLDFEAVLGRKCYQILHGTTEFIPGCPIVKARASGVRETLELQVGNKFFIVVADPVKDTDGTVIGFVHILRDITVQKLAELSLNKSEQTLRSTLDGLSAIIAQLDENGTILVVNRAWREFAWHNGLAPDTVFEGINYLKVCDEALGEGSEGAAQFADGIRGVLAGHVGSYVLEYPCHSPDKKRWFIGRVTLFSGQGPRRAVVAHEDITERRTAEEALKLELIERRRVEVELRETEDILTEALHIAHMGTRTYNHITEQFYWSDEVYRILGIQDCKSMSFHGFMEYVHPDDYGQLAQAWSSLNAAHSSFEIEYRIIRPDGAIRYLYEYGIYKYDEDGVNLSSACLLHDITDRKLAEKAIQEKSAEMERFTYSVSHDLRSPLVTIRTFLGHLGEDIDHRDAKSIDADMGFIKNASQKMVDLLDELLQLSRIGRMVNPSVETPFQDLAREAVDLVAGQIKDRGAQVLINDDRVLLYGDRSRLIEVFQNLIDNAVKYMGDQSQPLIVIGAKYKNGDVLVNIRDNGMGIDPLYRDRLFNVFERLNPELKGAGLGLVLVKRVVEIHGGKVWVESEGLGKGSCFYFTLPRKSLEA